MLAESPSSRVPLESLRPARALVHPLWVASLALLIANDRLFKGAGLLPGFVTGKLSDAAGTLVAPALLATLLRVRSRRAVTWCHLAVGAAFAAIKLSSTAAHALEQSMTLVGLDWRIWVDPTDLLVALPALLASHRFLAAPMAEALSAERGVRRLGELAAAVVGLVACMGTSQVPPEAPPEAPPHAPMLTAPVAPLPGPTIDLAFLEGGEWRCEGQGPFTSYRFQDGRYVRSSDLLTPETGVVSIVAAGPGAARLHFGERLEGKETLGDLEAEIQVADDGSAFELDGRVFRRGPRDTVIAGE